MGGLLSLLSSAGSFLVGFLSKAGSIFAEWLFNDSVPAWGFVGATLLAVAVAIGGTLWMGGEDPRKIVKTVRDTVERPILKRDTVETTRPVRVRVYDTVQTTKIDTQYIPVPEDFTVGGLVSERPVHVEDLTFTLTEYRPEAGRFVQSTYHAQPDPWAIDVEGALTTGIGRSGLQSIGISETVGISYTDGPWTFHGAAGMALGATSENLSLLGVGEVSVSYEITSWKMP